jgi:hypothetical protein
MATTGPTAPDRRRWTALLDRWPTALAVTPWALTLGGGELDETVQGFSDALLLLPWPFVIGATLQRRKIASWPVLGAAIVLITALRIMDVVAPATVLVAVGLALLVWSATSRHPHRHPPGSDLRKVQALGMVGFVAMALTAMAVDPDLGRYVVAAGWFLHGVWDFVHLKLDKVVLRSYAEWCGVFDMLVAIQLVFLV